jgi:hypothetical protein
MWTVEVFLFLKNIIEKGVSLKIFFIFCVSFYLIVPAMIYAEIDTEVLLKDDEYALFFYPYFQFYYGYKERVTFNSDKTISVTNCVGSGKWSYLNIFKKRFIAQYDGEAVDQYGGRVYFLLIGKSSYGLLDGFALWLHRPFDPVQNAIPCHFTGVPIFVY